jgi:glycosyltransferase involved in cell wall biosynthesis
MAKICLLTPTQPSINPRLVKEADALVEVGHQVHVLCSHTVPWADHSDEILLRTRLWSCSYVGGEPGSARYWWSRLRHGVIRRFPQAWKPAREYARFALSRVTPELQVAAFQLEADLYVAHYVGALAAAGVVAEKKGALLAFDAEDFESGYYEYKTGPRAIDLLTEEVEREYLPQCCYVTAASPGIGAAHASKYGIATPTSILNVFPLRERPLQFRETSPGGPLKVYWFSQTIGPGRGLENVIRAMAVLRDCDIELYLRGRCTSGYEERLLQLAQDNELDLAKVHFCPPAPAEDMIRLSAEYDVGLALEQPDSPNRDLCLTNKIFSYLLAGNVVAATSTTGQRAIVKTLGPAGFLYEPGDSEALAGGLRSWHDDRSELQRARRAAWGLGTHQFNWDLEKKKLVEGVNGVLMHQESGSTLGSTVIG